MYAKYYNDISTVGRNVATKSETQNLKLGLFSSNIPILSLCRR